MGLDHRLHAEIGDPVHLRLVDHLDLHARCDVDAVQKRHPVGGLADRAGGHDADLFGFRDAVFLQQLAVAPQNQHASLGGLLPNAAPGVRVVAEVHILGERFEQADRAVADDLTDRHADRGGPDVNHRDRTGLRWGGRTAMRFVDGGQSVRHGDGELEC